MEPQHIGRNKIGRKVGIIHGASPGLLTHPLGKGVQRHGLIRWQQTANLTAHHQRPGAGGEEAGAVCSILHRVREGNEFLMFVETAAIELMDHHRRQAGGARPEDRDALLAVAEGTLVGKLKFIPALLEHIRDQHGQQPIMATVAALRVALLVQGETSRAELLMLTTVRLFGEHQHHRAAMIEELAIDLVQLGFQLGTLTMAHAGPTGSMAIPAMHYRQIVGPILNAEIISKMQCRALCHTGNQTGQLPQPKLGTQLHKGPHRSRLTLGQPFLLIGWCFDNVKASLS